MPIAMRCPSCERPLRVPDNLLGTRVRCPGCREIFTAQTQGNEPGPGEHSEPNPGHITERPTPAARRPPSLMDSPEEQPEVHDPYDDEFDDYDGVPRRRRGSARERALREVSGPALALIIVGGLAAGVGVLRLIMHFAIGAFAMAGPNAGFGGPGAPNPMELTIQMAGGMVGSTLGIVLGTLVLFGGYQMKTLRSRSWAMAGSILAMLPCGGCCILGLPFGIWSLVVLNQPDVIRAFE